MKQTLRSFLLLILLASPLAAQSSSRPLEFPRDSALFRRLREFIVPRVQSNIADRDSLPSYPLLFRIQDSGDSPQWSVLQREIGAAVRGREPIANDSLKHTVLIGNARITDTLFQANVTIGTETRCGADWVSDGQVHSVFATRDSQGSWSPLGATQVLNYDSFGCLVLAVPLAEMPRWRGTWERLQRQHPCPARRPSWWTAADSSLGRGFKCTLVAAAVAAATDVHGSPDVPAIDTARAACVRLVSYVFFYRPERPAEWVVSFRGDELDLQVKIDAVTGKAVRYGTGGDPSACGN